MIKDQSILTPVSTTESSSPSANNAASEPVKTWQKQGTTDVKEALANKRPEVKPETLK